QRDVRRQVLGRKLTAAGRGRTSFEQVVREQLQVGSNLFAPNLVEGRSASSASHVGAAFRRPFTLPQQNCRTEPSDSTSQDHRGRKKRATSHEASIVCGMIRVRLVLACVVAGTFIASCTNMQGASGSTKQRLSIATGGTGGVFYPYGGGIAKIISENLPGVEATVEVTAASIDNLKFLKQGTSDIAFTMADIAQDALQSRDAFTTFGAVPLRTLAVLYSSYTHLVATEESGITSVAQLKGHVVSV